MRRTLAVALIASGAIAAGASGASSPQLKITKASHATVRGIGFHSHERVRVKVRLPRTISTRQLTATAAGTFVATFPSVMLPRCHAYSVTAVGESVSSVAIARHPACPVQ